MTASFIPKQGCTNASGGCFTAGGCIFGCSAQPSAHKPTVQRLMDWQPISTAPRDGTCVVLGFTVNDEFDWHPGGPITAAHDGNSWFGLETGEAIDGPEPTHWLPLPPLEAKQPAGQEPTE